MDTTPYIVKATEAVLGRKKVENPGNVVVRWAVILFLAGLAIYSAVTKDNIFLRMSNGYKLFLIFAFLWAILTGNVKKEYEPSEIEIRFYPDYLELYRPKRKFSNGKEKRTLTVFQFHDIKNITFDQASKRLIIQGKLTDTVWQYKNGILPKEPTSTTVIEDGFDVIITTLDTEHHFAELFGEHTPIKIHTNREIDLGFNKLMNKKGK